MPNDFKYADWLVMTCLDLLETKRGITKHFNTEFNKEFKRPYAVGEKVSVPYPAQFKSRRGLEYQPQEVKRRSAVIEFDEPFGVDFEWDSAEQALRAPRGKEKVEKEILDPAMSQLCQDIESAAAFYAYVNAASVVGALGTNPNTYDQTSAAARQVMQELNCPAGGDRGMAVPPAVMRAVKTQNLALTNPAKVISKQFQDGYVQSADGFDWFESMSLYRHTAGTWAGAVTVSGALSGTDAITSLTVACTTADTFKKGDKISIANVLPVGPQTRRTFGTWAKTFAITQDVVGVSSAAVLPITPAIYGPGSPYQNVDALPVNGAALTLWPGTSSPSGKSGQVGLALHQNAFALVGAELELPKSTSVELVAQRRDPDSGVAIRFIRMFDGKSSKMINRFDAMIGFGTFYNDACAAVVACG